ncbi:MAG: EAL domain-containing protein [Geminicoccaceae bacterium]|nr:EAL domain-containing protein [Geminicoccaceae bacterium]
MNRRLSLLAWLLIVALAAGLALGLVPVPLSRLLGLPLLDLDIKNPTLAAVFRFLGIVAPLRLAAPLGTIRGIPRFATRSLLLVVLSAVTGRVELALILVALPFLRRIMALKKVRPRRKPQDGAVHEACARRLIEEGGDALLYVRTDGTIDAANGVARVMLRTDPVGRPLAHYLPLLREPDASLAALAGQVIEAEFQEESTKLRPAEIAFGRGERDGGWQGLVRITDIAARQGRTAELERLALHDTLTGLPNRKQLQDRLDTARRRAVERGEPFVILMLDLDKFKQVNDTFGHHVGDLLLQAVAPRLREPLRQADLLARLGGDEFAVLLTDTTLPMAASIAERLVEAIHKPFTVEAMRLELGVSIGVAGCPKHGNDPDTLLQSADFAMYKAKREGLGFCVFDSGQSDAGSQRLLLQRQLKEAIEDNRMAIVVQPKVHGGTWQVSGGEVLVRWQRPEGGRVEPAEFLPVAEQTGLIQPLTLSVLNQTLEGQRDWRLRGFDLPLSINVSSKWLYDETFPKIIRLFLRNWSGRADRLTLEFPESAIMMDPGRTLKLLQELAEQNVSLSLDDFGTGHSSLPLLQRLPIQELKIDRSFVAGMGQDKNAAIVVRSIVKMAHGLGLRVVAKGVTNRVTAEWLGGLGCDELQGFFFGEPIDPEAFIQKYHVLPETKAEFTP